MFKQHRLICNKCNMTGVTSGAGTAYPSGEHYSYSCCSILGFLEITRILHCGYKDMSVQSIVQLTMLSNAVDKISESVPSNEFS